MSNDLSSVMSISASGLAAQSARMKVIAENLANAQTTAQTPGGKPYERKIVSFRDVYDRTLDADKVKMSGITTDKTPFTRKFDPAHPAADKDGYVLLPNVRTLVENMDMREAQRSYEANLTVIDASRNMMLRTIDLLRN